MTDLVILVLVGFALSFTLLEFYFKLARNKGIFDVPNIRSSHQSPTIRGGGIIFFFAVTFLLVAVKDYLTLIWVGALFLGVVSFIDDVKGLSPRVRLFTQVLAVSLVLYALEIYSVIGLWSVLLYVPFILGLNIYNFMDGINGITVLNTITILIGLMGLKLLGYIQIPEMVLYVLSISALTFAFYNLRKVAVTFLGDIGSIILGFIFISIVLAIVIDTNQYQLMFLFTVYLIDGAGTIFQRFFNGENILKPHRKHLYQLLANERGFSHLKVSSIYFFFQLMINSLLLLTFHNQLLSFSILGTVFFILSFIYFIFKRKYSFQEQ